MKKVLFGFLIMTIVLTSCNNYDDEFDALNASVRDLQSQVSSISTLQTNLSSIQNTVNSLQTALDGSGADLSHVMTNVTSLQTDLDALIMDFSDAGLAATQETLAVLQADVDNLLAHHNMDSFILNLDGLEELGDDFVYEGWIIVDGNPVSTGVFSSIASPQLFTVGSSDLALATKFVLSIEPAIDSDLGPAATKILVGDFSGDSAILSSAIVGDFTASTGAYILATPTDGPDTNENSGIWFLDPTGGTPVAGLHLPQLADGWKYEGWTVIDGVPVSTGTFTNVAGTDDNDMFSGPIALPSPNGPDGFFPGEDFLVNAPNGLTFPTNLAGGTAVISVEPYPDNSSNPFALKPLVGQIPGDAIDHTLYTMNQNLGSLPTGSVTR